ncbi:MAG: hypothetical protein CR968_03705 [Flavobacteriia bacterium]|nr:MAG: hypothetical protein CR968_03705 [Flavobacteriia bacterium]
MKKFLLFLGLVGLFTAASAQTVYWSDDFNDFDISDWTLIDADGDGNNWSATQINDSNGNPVTPVSLISRSWMQSPLTPDNWAISPAIDLSSASGTIEISYITQVASASWDEEKYSLYVSTSNDIASLEASETQMTEVLGDDGNTGTPVNHTFDISSFAGESTVYIAFRHHDVTDMDFISIDDVTVASGGTGSLEDLQALGFTYYPNPVNDVLNLKADVSINEISVSNLLGQEVYRSTPNMLQQTVDFSNLETGVYMVSVSIDGNEGTFKIVKR